MFKGTMKIMIPGGSGQIGTVLARALHRDGHDVVVLSRRPVARPWRVVTWDATSLGPWTSELDGCDAVINLTGRSVNCRYTAANRKEIFDSRLIPTRLIGRAIAQSARPPRVWLQASTATLYAHRFDTPNDDVSGIIGGNEPNTPDTWKFSIEVARAWEQAFTEAAVPRTRKVALRSAVTLSADAGGPFDILLRLVRYGLGGAAGDGRQFVSWIHYGDFVRAVRWLIDHDGVDGAVNIAAPEPLPNSEFMRVLRDAWGMPIGLPATNWMLEIGAAFMRTETELILKSRRVVPRRLLEQGFEFTFPHWNEAAQDLCRTWRIARHERRAPSRPGSSEARGEARGVRQ